MELKIKHYIDDDCLYVIEIPSVISRKTKFSREYKCLVRLTKHDRKRYEEYEELKILENWLNDTIIWWQDEEGRHFRQLENKIMTEKKYYWSWDSSKDKLEFIGVSSKSSSEYFVHSKIDEFKSLKHRWSKVVDTKFLRAIKSKVLKKALKELVLIKLYDYEN